MSQEFYVKELSLNNFKNFEQENFEFAFPFTLIIGNNGRGKTAILDALSIALSNYLLGFELKTPIRDLQYDDVRRQTYKRGTNNTTIEPQFPASLSGEFIINGDQLEYEITTTLKDKVEQDLNLRALSNQTYQHLEQDNNLILPMIAYYGTGRLWKLPHNNQNNRKDIFKKNDRTDGYIYCLNPDVNLQWFIEFLEQEDKSSNSLSVIQSTIKECLNEEGWTNIEYKYDQSGEGEVCAENKDGNLLPIRMLSDGIRNMLVMVADIAYRCAVLNPNLGINAAQETPGIVLIDEIDLHLHPKWQRRVVEELHQAFPKIQFIATTHSPFIIQSLRLGSLINLDSDEPVEYYNQSIEDITENVMGEELPQKSRRYIKKMEVAEEYYRILQDAKNGNSERLDELETKLDELTMPYSDDPAYHAFLNMERREALSGKR
jgi:predicted ATP-binding protein involved in virulence